MASFAPTDVEICIVRGDSPVIPVQVQDSTGAALDITGGTFVMTVDPSDSPSDATNNLFAVNGTITDAANGRVQFQPTTVQSDQSPGENQYDVQMDLNSSVRTILKGKFEIQQDITKA